MPTEPPDEFETRQLEPADFRRDRLLAELLEDSQRLSEALRFLREGMHDRSMREALRKADLEAAETALLRKELEEQRRLVDETRVGELSTEDLQKAGTEAAKTASAGGKPEQEPLVADEDQQLEVMVWLLKNANNDVQDARKSIAETEQKLRGAK